MNFSRFKGPFFIPFEPPSTPAENPVPVTIPQRLYEPSSISRRESLLEDKWPEIVCLSLSCDWQWCEWNQFRLVKEFPLHVFSRIKPLRSTDNKQRWVFLKLWTLLDLWETLSKQFLNAVYVACLLTMSKGHTEFCHECFKYALILSILLLTFCSENDGWKCNHFCNKMADSLSC